MPIMGHSLLILDLPYQSDGRCVVREGCATVTTDCDIVQPVDHYYLLKSEANNETT